MKDADAAIINLQRDVEELKAAYEEHEKKLRRYEGMAAKWGGFLLGVTTVGVILANGVEKLKDKLLQMLVP